MTDLLIVNDQEGVLATRQYALTRPEVHVLTTKSRQAALALFQSAKPHASPVDLHTPGIDGLTLAERPRQLARNPDGNLPLCITSAPPIAGAKKVAQEIGALSFLKKPFDCAGLLLEVTRAISGQLEIPPTELIIADPILRPLRSGPSAAF